MQVPFGRDLGHLFLHMGTPSSDAFIERKWGQECIRREGIPEAAPEAVGQVVGGGTKAFGGGYCRLRIPWKLALAAGETDSGRA